MNIGRWRRIAKFLVALLIPVAQTVQAALTDDAITTNEWVKIAIAALGAILVWATPNEQPARSRHELAERVERFRTRDDI